MNLLLRFIPLLVFGFWFPVGNSQEVKSYARSVIDTLCSPHMHGRGYVNDGDKIAARYIRDEFKKLGLVSLTKDYYQHFTLPVNTVIYFDYEIYRGDAEPVLWTGSTILPSSSTPSIKGEYISVIFDTSIVSSNEKLKKFIDQDFKNKIIVIDSIGNIDKSKSIYFKNAIRNPFGAKAVFIFRSLDEIEREGKIISWDVSKHVDEFPVIHLEKGNLYNRTVSLEIKNKFHKKYKTQNIIGLIKGLQQSDSFIVFTTHYDHLGEIGGQKTGKEYNDRNIYFPGANDNASGVAMLLNLAKHYSKPENKPKYSMLFIAFGAEEAGLVGSKYFVENPLVPLNKIKFLINMDLMGTGDDGMMVVNGAVHKEEYNMLVKINDEKKYLPQIKARGKAANSDHYFFSEAGVKSFFFYTLGGIKAYHDVFDRPETLPLTKFEEIFNLINDFVKGI